MKKNYLKPDAEFIRLVAQEKITAGVDEWVPEEGTSEVDPGLGWE